MDNATPALSATESSSASEAVAASNNSSIVESKGPVYESPAVPASVVSENKWSDSEAAAAASQEAASNGMLANPAKKSSDSESPGSHSGSRKNGRSNDSGHSLRCSVNKFTPQFKKTQHRRNASPVNWFPRKKADTFLMRKIRHLQEVEGMNLSLDETLGNANPHYTRMAREKIAAREAATKAMEAHKAAMVEGAWCRILEAARIQSKEAETEFEKAKKYDVEAFEAARAMGVMMYDRPDCPRRPWDVESSSAGGGGSTHTVTASFETAFEVDKEVAAAVKEAFIRLANCPSYSNKEEFQDLLRKLCENPDNGTDQEMEEELKRESISRLGTILHCADFSDDEVNKLDIELKQNFRELPHKFNENPDSKTDQEIKEEFDSIQELHCANITDDDAVNKHETELKQEKHRCGKYSTGCNNNSSKTIQELINMMLDRLKGLEEHELASLAIIVATRGLNAALLEVKSGKDHGCESTGRCPGTASLETATRRNNGSTCVLDGHMEGGGITRIELPSLDKILVKRVSRLEREVQEARNSKKRNSISTHPENTGTSSKERATERHMELGKETGQELPSLDKILVKHVSRLEREVQEARNSKKSNSILAYPKNLGTAKEQAAERFPVRSNSISTSLSSNSDLGSILVKHVSKLEREIQEAKKLRKNNSVADIRESMEIENRSVTSGVQSLPTQKLGEILVNYSSPNKQKTNGEICERSLKKKCKNLKDSQLSEFSQSGDSNINESDLLIPLDDGRYDDENIDINKVVSSSTTTKKMNELGMKKMQSTKIPLVKNTSRTERVNLRELKVLSSPVGRNETNEPSGLDKILVKHVHRLEREKMQVPLIGNDYTMKRNNRKHNDVADSEGLDKILIKHVSRLEKEKLAQGTRLDVLKVNKSSHWVQSTESLGDILVEHQPKLEKAKLDASSEDRVKHVNTFRQTRDRELQEAWGGLSLENSIQPRLSRLELDKAAWRRAEEEERI